MLLISKRIYIRYSFQVITGSIDIPASRCMVQFSFFNSTCMMGIIQIRIMSTVLTLHKSLNLGFPCYFYVFYVLLPAKPDYPESQPYNTRHAQHSFTKYYVPCAPPVPVPNKDGMHSKTQNQTTSQVNCYLKLHSG